MSINDLYIDSLERRVQRLNAATKELISAVEQYVEPKPGTPYLHRTELLNTKNKVKSMLK